MHTEWYFTEYHREGEIEDWITGEKVVPFNTFRGYVLILNLDGESDADIEFTFYYEDQAPAKANRQLAAGREGLVYLGDDSPNKPDVPLDKRFGIGVKSSCPIIVQCTQGDYIHGSPVTNNMVTNMFTPGPLGEKHTVWYYIDCIVLRNPSPLEEREWITLLNPNAEPAHVTLTFFPGGMMQPGTAEVRLADPDEDVFQVGLEVGAERILQTRLHEDITTVKPNHHYSVRIESDVSITAQATRRIFERGNYAFSRSIAVLDCIPMGRPET
jgi:hypothetical protein